MTEIPRGHVLCPIFCRSQDFHKKIVAFSFYRNIFLHNGRWQDVVEMLPIKKELSFATYIGAGINIAHRDPVQWALYATFDSQKVPTLNILRRTVNHIYMITIH